jgi:hypothetical protein
MAVVELAIIVAGRVLVIARSVPNR